MRCARLSAGLSGQSTRTTVPNLHDCSNGTFDVRNSASFDSPDMTQHPQLVHATGTEKRSLCCQFRDTLLLPLGHDSACLFPRHGCLLTFVIFWGVADAWNARSGTDRR